MAKSDEDAEKIYDSPRSKKARAEQKEAKKGDVETDSEGQEWESYGSRGTRKGGNIHDPKDKEGDLDEAGWDKLSEEDIKKSSDKSSRTTKDNKDPSDEKGWRREYWGKRVRPMS